MGLALDNSIYELPASEQRSDSPSVFFVFFVFSVAGRSPSQAASMNPDFAALPACSPTILRNCSKV